MGATKDADILIFVLPHQFVRQTCKIMQEYVKDTALAISLIKVTIVQPLYDTPCYNMDLDITLSCFDAQNVFNHGILQRSYLVMGKCPIKSFVKLSVYNTRYHQ